MSRTTDLNTIYQPGSRQEQVVESGWTAGQQLGRDLIRHGIQRLSEEDLNRRTLRVLPPNSLTHAAKEAWLGAYWQAIGVQLCGGADSGGGTMVWAAFMGHSPTRTPTPGLQQWTVRQARMMGEQFRRAGSVPPPPPLSDVPSLSSGSTTPRNISPARTVVGGGGSPVRRPASRGRRDTSDQVQGGTGSPSTSRSRSRPRGPAQ